MSYSEYFTPTHVYLGEDTELLAGKILKENGAKKVLVHFGSSSAEKSGLLEKVLKTLDDNRVSYVKLGGVQPNPRLSLARKGIALCREEKVDFILAIGGGSVIDSAKCIAYGVPYDGDVWDFYCGKAVQKERLPFGTILTLSATGSEMSNSSVITNDEKTPNDKFGSNTDLGRPVFSLLNPKLTFTVSKFQTGSGSSDIIMHTLERFFQKGSHLDLTDELAASIIRNVIVNTRKALENPNDYDARANLMWAGSLSHNDLTQQGSESRGDWTCHKLEHELSAIYDVAHGAGLAAIWGSWATYVKAEEPERFATLGRLVFGPDFNEADKAIEAMVNVFRSFAMPVNLHELGIMADDSVCTMLADKATLSGSKKLGNFKLLDRNDIFEIFKSAK